MLDYLLPEHILNVLRRYDNNKIYEIRLRRNASIVINYAGKNVCLTTEGLYKGEKVFSSASIIEYVVKKATENSLYAYNNQIKQGFITARGGVRLGIAGESVNSDNFMPTTIKNINAIDIRIPHEVKGCSKVAFKFIYSKESGIRSTLIISPPGAGKTTFLRDICRQISLVQEKIYNTLLVDERFEISSTSNGIPMLDIGEYTDVVSGASKEFAFSNGIRSLSPDVIVTDELMSGCDVAACIQAVRSGVKVIASVHADSYNDLRDKDNYKKLFETKCFERYVVLSNKNGAGTYEGVFDENLNCIYF